jgi:hypothetical protein
MLGYNTIKFINCHFAMLIHDKIGFSMLDYDQIHKLSFCYVR